MILMPTETNRKKLIKYTESFRGICELFEAEADRRILAPHYLTYVDKNKVYINMDENKNPKWIDKKFRDVVDELSNRSFFKRFRLHRIIEMVNTMELLLVG